MRKVSGVVLVLAGFALLGGPAADAASRDQVWLPFDSGAADVGHIQSGAKNRGTAGVTSRVVTQDGGNAVRARGRSGYAVRFPKASSAANPPRAVLRVTNDAQDQLSPGRSWFKFGAEVRLFADSDGTQTDNGDNVLQRGLYDDQAQYKLQVDKRRPECRVKGARGAVLVRSTVRMKARDWYRLVCTRDDSAVTLRVVHFLRDGSRSSTTKTNVGRTGSVAAETASVPMSVGGKLSAAGLPMASTDQLNGVVDEVFLRIRD